MDVAAKEAFFEGGTDAFIEDWLETGKNARTSHLRGGWKRRLNGQWHAFGRAQYSVNYWDLDPGKAGRLTSKPTGTAAWPRMPPVNFIS